MKSSRMLLLTGCMLATAVAAQDNNRPSAKKDDESAAAVQASRAAAAKGVNSETYKIGPQDVLRIDVWREEQLTRTVPVRPDGKVTLPLVNDVQAAGLTPMELATVVREGMKKYLNDPQVTVSVTEINSRRVYVTGEVARAGAFPLLPNMSVLQALSSSGGFTQFAKLKNIYVLRLENGKQIKLPFNYKDVVSGKKPEQNLLLEPGDVIVVP
jgi:polysaccharide biosynthesis/export protein